MFHQIPLINKCQGVSTKGKPCHSNAKPGYSYCKRHGEEIDDELKLCEGHNQVKRAEYGNICKSCHKILCHRNFSILLNLVRAECPVYWMNNIDYETMRLPSLIEESQIPHSYIRPRMWDIQMYIQIFTPIETITHRTELARLSHDNENVHTVEVNTQTSTNMDKLLNVHVPNDIKPIENLKVMFPKKKKMVQDMTKWYKTKTCVNENDYLYKKLLNGLWKMIQDSSHKDELIKRLCEEATESIDKCCQGHLSRLCNVMVGFDDDFKPPVPIGELLQQQMSAIAQKDITTCQKVFEAWKVMDELNIPLEERDAWIEAF